MTNVAEATRPRARERDHAAARVLIQLTAPATDSLPEIFTWQVSKGSVKGQLRSTSTADVAAWAEHLDGQVQEKDHEAGSDYLAFTKVWTTVEIDGVDIQIWTHAQEDQ
jgi:hypothetical protein